MLFSVAGGSVHPWAEPQMIRFGVGLVGMVAIAMIDIRFWRAMAPVAYVGVARCCSSRVDVMGFVGMGAQRWIELGPIQIQPSEMMKIALVMALAAYYNWLPPEKVSRIFWVILPLLLILMPVALVLEQPDLGTAILLLAGGGAVMFLAGVSLWYFGFARRQRRRGGDGGAEEPRAPSWQLLHEYQFRRIFTFLDPGRRPARRRLPHHPGEDRHGLGRAGRARLHAGDAEPAQLPAREAHRLHPDHAGRGVRLRRHGGAARASMR